MTDTTLRLSKLMSERGLCSRREADELIAQGLVYVDGIKIDTLGTKVSPNCKIQIQRQGNKQLEKKLTVILYKPLGYLSGPREDNYPSALDLISLENKSPESNSIHFKEKQNMAVAGRLDVDSTGLLVLTSDGRVAKKIIGENSPVEKEYLVKVRGTLTAAQLKILNYGLELDGKKLKKADVSWVKPNEILKFVLNEGKKRQIRRMCELVDLEVIALKRVRVGNLTLKNLEPSEWRVVTQDEIETLLSL